MSTRRVDDIYAASYDTPWGEGWVYVKDGCLIGVDLPGEAAGPCRVAAGSTTAAGGSAAAGDDAAGGFDGSAAAPPDAVPGKADAEALASWVGQLQAYFAGERTTWGPAEVALDYLGLGSFERAVYEALLSIPPGETISYGELAEMAGYPRAARAVGNAMAANPIPVVVPCHRVVHADGRLGNYGNDPRWKERLLVHEGWGRRSAG